VAGSLFQVVTAGASGAVKLWDVTVRDNYPIASFSGHDADVASVDWNLTTKDAFVTGSWDATVCVRALCLVPLRLCTVLLLVPWVRSGNLVGRSHCFDSLATVKRCIACSGARTNRI
jgi:hypothetical protein